MSRRCYTCSMTSAPTITEPYDEAARLYLAAGWQPIPVHEKGPPVKGATGYAGTVTPVKVAAWLSPNPSTRHKAGRWWGANNIAIRHHETLAIDIDAGGDLELILYGARRGLPELPPTWSSTAHGPHSPIRQHLYRIPGDLRFETHPCRGVDLCVWHHRYTVCWPSVHPGTGQLYRWYEPGGEAADRAPAVSELAVLPQEWVAAFRVS